MSTSIRVAIVTAALVAMSTLSSASVVPASAGPVDCKWCVPDPEVSAHYFTTNCNNESFDCMHCSTFNACHTAQPGQAGDCRDFHWQCFYSPEAMAPLEEFIESEPREEIVALAAAFPETVVVSVDGFVLVLGCTGEVVRAVKVADSAPEVLLLTTSPVGRSGCSGKVVAPPRWRRIARAGRVGHP